MGKQTTLGACIRDLRKQKGMTQAQLADLLGVTDKAVSKWERDRSYPDITLIPKLADVLETTVDGLLRECREECRPSRLLQVYEMSRDIRTPLHIILGLAEIIQCNHDDPEMLEKYLDGIRISGEYMLSVLTRNGMGGPGQESAESGTRCGCGNSRKEDPSDMPKEADRSLQEQIDAGRQKGQVPRFSGRRILVAEDMAINRKIAAEILRQAGADTEFAEDGEVCLRKLQEAPAGYYDLILMDITMPEMDGLEAARRIRNLPDRKKAGIPIVAMTANVSERDRKAAMEAGMNDFAEKPIFVDKLFGTLQKYLKEK